MPQVLAGDDIPYPALGRELFDPNNNEQKLIPFLGAGASLGPAASAPPPAVPYPDRATIDGILDALQLQPGGRARASSSNSGRCWAVISTSSRLPARCLLSPT